MDVQGSLNQAAQEGKELAQQLIQELQSITLKAETIEADLGSLGILRGQEKTAETALTLLLAKLKEYEQQINRLIVIGQFEAELGNLNSSERTVFRKQAAQRYGVNEQIIEDTIAKIYIACDQLKKVFDTQFTITTRIDGDIDWLKQVIETTINQARSLYVE